MPFYVYILANTDDNRLYKGFTENPSIRLQQHNNKESSFTSTKSGWYFVCVIEFDNKKEGLIFEKKIKRWNRSSIENLIYSKRNIADKFLNNSVC